MTRESSAAAAIREFTQHDPRFSQPSPLIVDLVAHGATQASLNRSA
jgi:hypothetical protein